MLSIVMSSLSTESQRKEAKEGLWTALSKAGVIPPPLVTVSPDLVEIEWPEQNDERFKEAKTIFRTQLDCDFDCWFRSSPKDMLALANCMGLMSLIANKVASDIFEQNEALPVNKWIPVIPSMIRLGNMETPIDGHYEVCFMRKTT